MKTLLYIIAMFLSIKSFSQPFLSLGVTNKGVNIQLGILAGPVDITMALKSPFTRNDVPTITSLSVGKQWLITSHDADNYSITTSIGVASYRLKDYKAYDADPTGATGIYQVSEKKMFYGLELGKDSYMGRLFIHANYCGGPHYGVGLKMFFFRN